MDHAPRELFALLRDGEIEEVLQSNTPWYCVSCYQCVVRCPREIPVTDIMYRLKQMALESGLAETTNKMPDFYRAFSRLVEHTGRMTDTTVMALYGIKHPVDVARNTGLALRLLKKGRIDILPMKVEKIQNITRLLSDDREEGDSR
jgi:heterodisulfide reductase subunit C/quinone-modifying oxidoreductase subunit QmoC